MDIVSLFTSLAILAVLHMVDIKPFVSGGQGFIFESPVPSTVSDKKKPVFVKNECWMTIL